MIEGNISFILISAICSFPQKIKIVINLKQAVPNAAMEPGGRAAAISPIKTECISMANMPLMLMESTGLLSEANSIH